MRQAAARRKCFAPGARGTAGVLPAAAMTAVVAAVATIEAVTMA
jgi:hypothetical protein